LHLGEAGGDLVQKCEVDPRSRLFSGVHETIVVIGRSGGLRPPQAAARRTNLLRVPQAMELCASGH
jgi:hypothetical protein